MATFLGIRDVHQPFSLPVKAKLAVTHTTRRRVTGDITFETRRSQEEAGFTSNERGTYVAKPVAHCKVWLRPRQLLSVA